MGHTADEAYPFGEAERVDQAPQRRLRRPAADEQENDIVALRQDRRQRTDEQIQPFIGVERADEAENLLAGEAELVLQPGIEVPLEWERVGVDGIGNDRDFVGGQAASEQLAAQALADRRDRGAATQDEGFEPAAQTITQTARHR